MSVYSHNIISLERKHGQQAVGTERKLKKIKCFTNSDTILVTQGISRIHENYLGTSCCFVHFIDEEKWVWRGCIGYFNICGILFLFCLIFATMI